MLKSLLFVRKNQWQTKIRQIQWTVGEFSGYQMGLLSEHYNPADRIRLLYTIATGFWGDSGNPLCLRARNSHLLFKDLRLKNKPVHHLNTSGNHDYYEIDDEKDNTYCNYRFHVKKFHTAKGGLGEIKIINDY